MDDGPFASFAYPNGDGFHQASAVGAAVTGNLVQMDAEQAARAMVSVLGSGAAGGNKVAAVSALETGKRVFVTAGLEVAN